MKRTQVNTNANDMLIEAMVADSGIWAYSVARRRAEAGRIVLEMWASGGGNVRIEINIAAKLITHSF